MDYLEFIQKKSQIGGEYGFEPYDYPENAFDFQKSLIEWSVRKGRSAIYADCGLGKSLIELSFADNVSRHTGGNVLLLTPIAVGRQMEREAEKFGIEAHRSRNGSIGGKITITNYEQLHHFQPEDFTGIVCDESSILKNFSGKTKQHITAFSRKLKYRLLATATAAPNDFIELGTSSEALGYLGYMDMLSKFFVNDLNNSASRFRGDTVHWRLKGHAHDAFWRWVVSWSRSLRRPSDIGFCDDGYNLTNLIENHHLVDFADPQRHGMLFAVPANGLDEQRKERRATIDERCEAAAGIVSMRDDFTVVWCNLNDEGDLLEKIIPGAVQVSGRDTDEGKEDKLAAFSDGQIKTLIIKPKIGAWGLNWQHCNHTVFFPTHSYEQYYQAIRRFLRFGQKRDVTADIVYSDGDGNIISNLMRKKKQSEKMFDRLVEEANNALSVSTGYYANESMEVPKWL